MGGRRSRRARGAAVQVATTVQQTGFPGGRPDGGPMDILITVNTTAPNLPNSTPSPPYPTPAGIPAASFFPAAVFMPFAAPGLTARHPRRKRSSSSGGGGFAMDALLHVAVLSSA